MSAGQAGAADGGATQIAGLVSVIVPAFNAARFLDETVRAVFGQTYEDWELILVDDGSTDETPSIARRLLEDRRVRYIRQDNAGVSAARNHGLAAASGEFVAFLDADDLWAPRNLERKVAFLLEHPDVDIVGGDVNLIDARSRETGARLTTRGGRVLRNLLLWDGTVVTAPSALLARRTLALALGGFDPAFSTAADQDFCFRAAARGAIGHVDEILTYYRKHGSNMHANIARMERDHIGVYRKAERAGLFASWWFKRRCFSNLYLILAGSWWVDGGSRVRGGWFLVRALAAWPPNVVKVFGKLRRRL